MKNLIPKNLFGLLFMLILLGISTGLSAQRTITGTLTDAEDGEPLIGANIIIQGSSTGTVTDFDGTYSISVPDDANFLEISYTGYTTQVVEIGASNVVDLAMRFGEDLEEIVVIGYGTVRKRDATGAVESLSAKDFNKGIQTSPDQLIQGRVAGVNVTTSSGEPGAASNIRIRGTASIRAGNNPLFVLDGVPLDGRDVSAGADVGAGRTSARNPLNFINPNDIESINILKDASATAIYGSRGSNGVVIITTKQGDRERPEINYTTSLSTSSVTRAYDLLSADEFRSATNNPSIDFGGNVNAFDEITRNAIAQSHNISYGGASETGGQYRFSLGYLDQDGVIEQTGIKKYNASVKISQDLFDDRLKVSGNLIGSFIEDEGAALSDNVGAEGDMLISALRWNPTRPFRDESGELIQPSDNERNPLAFQNYYSDMTETSRIFGNISATLRLFEGLDYKVNFGVDRAQSERRVGVSRLLNVNFAINSGIGNIENINASTYLIEHTLKYKRDLTNNINMDILGGFSYQKFNRKGSNQRGASFISDDQNLYTNNLNYASSFPAANNGSFFDPSDELQSYFGRANFNILDKYLVTATLRADGSSRFGESNKYGYFPSAAVAWQLHEEEFIPDAFNSLKFRVGWGVTGNQEFPSGSAQSQFKPLDDGSGIQQTNVGNPDLKWERTNQTNIGLDFAILDYRLTGSIDWFNKNTTDLLFRLPTAQPGPDVFIWRNLEDVEVNNKGIEIGLDGALIEKTNFSWDLGVNVSFNSNELKNVSTLFPDGIITGEINGQGLSNQRAQLLYDNQELYAFYLPVFTGFNSEGLATYEDVNGDGENTASGIVGPGNGDRKFVGSPNPDVILGVRTGVNVGNFDASIYLNGAFGHQVFDNTALALFSTSALQGGANVDRRVLDSPQSTGDSPIPSTQFLEDAGFLRVSNVTLGYSLDLTEKVSWAQSIRVFVTGSNLAVFTGYNGFDPEVNTNKNVDDVPSFGIDYSSYPRSRTFTLGANVKF